MLEAEDVPGFSQESSAAKRNNQFYWLIQINAFILTAQ
jgi:hypothetical protein